MREQEEPVGSTAPRTYLVEQEQVGGEAELGGGCKGGLGASSEDGTALQRQPGWKQGSGLCAHTVTGLCARHGD